MSPTSPIVHTQFINVDGLSLFYRSAGLTSPSSPTILLLHGFPSSSFQYRNLIPILASTNKYRIIAPDFPGFGFTEVPEERKYVYSFDSFKNTTIKFLDALEVKKFVVYVFDYGSPTAFRIALERPESILGIVSQNGNAYSEGFGADFWAPIFTYWKEGTTADREALRVALTYETTKWQYTNGSPDPSKLAPEAWTLDAHLMQRPGNDTIQLDLFKDYGTNVPLYPNFQAYLRKSQPPLLAIWGKNDTIFIPPGAEAFKRDVPHATVELIDAGHFALESHLEVIASKMLKFLDEKVKF